MKILRGNNVANPENIEGQGFHTNPERINRSGRPKGSRNRATIVRELLEAKAAQGDGQVVDQLTQSLIQKAAEGDVRAYKELMDSAYGKVKDTVESNVTYTQMGHVYLQGDDGSLEKMNFNVGEPVRDSR